MRLVIPIDTFGSLISELDTDDWNNVKFQQFYKLARRLGAKNVGLTEDEAWNLHHILRQANGERDSKTDFDIEPRQRR